MNSVWLTDLTAWLSANPGWLSLALFSTAFVESLAVAGIIVPGVALLFAIAALAAQIGMPLMTALMWAGMGAVAGDATSFAIGRLFQGRLTNVWPLSRHPELIRKGERFFRSHGGKSVIIGRFVGPVRPIIPLIAGALLMPWRRFLAFNIASALGWAPVYILPGFLVGSALASEIQPPPHFYLVTGISLAILATIYVILFRFQLGLAEDGRFYLWLQRQMAQYESTHRFWRLYTNERPAHEGEFPLASLMLAFGSIALLVVWGQLTAMTDLITPFDQLALQWFSDLRRPLFDAPAIVATLMGDSPVLFAAAVLACLVLVFRGHYAAAIHILLAAVTATVLVWGLKSAIGIVRPDQVINPPFSGSFPSGHTTGTTVLVTLLASFVAAEARNRKRWQTYIMLSLPLIPVALSRLYLGVHWFSDIVGGLLLGLAITGATRASFSRFDRVPIAPDILTFLAAIAWLTFSGYYIWLMWPDAIQHYTPAS
ncbi:bifunctional DedA family/phosphatase PAP2 family protein [Marinobacter sp. 1_MG-2023]|uniref:bifunctional DedA family/phosphatase PAP2 family protein n=1 Tax=Marinobacter sp. 1_MG-2023 TaxID=3062627 RepID=UPI0026E358F2|nr:bifunctional DedA family/phosphatase PAP2 family protein [Marinobacter sp. 1_MG-2023]MDO6825357.1 bifunctional DedA family/phosphatase PAP2 family protein [Marinobacter sp. 1_MG-2023]